MPQLGIINSRIKKNNALSGAYPKLQWANIYLNVIQCE